MDETLNLLALISEHLPIDGTEWESVAEELRAMGHEGHEAQTVQSIRRKFQELHRKKAPTGDPTCPPHILEAKAIHRRIGHRADVGTGDEEYNFVTNQFGSNEHNQLEYAVDDVEVHADEVIPQNLANRGGRPSVSRRNNMVSFQDSLNSQ